LELNGWVNNTAHGVFIEVEGTRDKLDKFLLRVERQLISLPKPTA
jgi:hydrogenase maturation protein HypF